MKEKSFSPIENLMKNISKQSVTKTENLKHMKIAHSHS